MGKRKLGRYCEQAIRWLIPEVWKKWWRKKYPKCVPIAKARAMSKGQRAGAVKRKQAKANVGPTPDRAATFAKREKAANGGYMGSFIKLDVDGKTYGNPSLRKYYKGMV